MKDSGIKWIGEIPKEWKILPFKSYFNLSKGLNITKADLVQSGIPVISYGQIHSKLNNGTLITDKLLRFVSNEFLETNPNCLLKKGAFIFADTSEDKEGCGNAVYINNDKYPLLFAGYHTIIANPKNNFDNKYLAYLFLTDCWRIQLRSVVTGIKVFSINQKCLNASTILLPTIHEQRRIATFLDNKCKDIDTLITLQEEMIEELQAYKQSVISEAVTKGLNPNVTMKDSGVEWIGEIPKEWGIIKLRYLGYLQNGISKSGDYFGEGYPFMNYGDVYQNLFIKEPLSGLAKSNDSDQNLYSVEKGDVFFTRTSETIEEIGFSSVCLKTIDKAIFSGFLIRFRPKTIKLDSKFSGYYFRSNIHRKYFVKEMNLVTRASLGQNLLKDFIAVR